MIIYADRFRLRPCKESDTNSFFKIAHEELVKKYVPYAYPETLEDAKNLVECYSKGDLKNDFYLLIKKGEVPFGAIIAIRTYPLTLDVSTIVLDGYRGKGIMTTAMNGFIDWIKKNTNYRNIVMIINKENVASRRMAKKIGAVLAAEGETDNAYEVVLR